MSNEEVKELMFKVGHLIQEAVKILEKTASLIDSFKEEEKDKLAQYQEQRKRDFEKNDMLKEVLQHSRIDWEASFMD